MSRQVVVYSDLDTLSRDVAERLLALAMSAIALRGTFTIALAGGSTPKRLYTLLAANYADALDWSKVQFFFGDERSVPPDHADSNYRMANEAMLTKLAMPTANVHRMRGEAEDIAMAAAEYEEDVRQTFGSKGIPVFDLILAGMGPDGHTLSLFPHTAALNVTDKLVTANHVDKLNTNRITFTYSLANNAANYFFLVGGADKADSLREVLEGAPNRAEYPSQGIAPTNGDLIWFVDTTAAAKLEKTPTTRGTVTDDPIQLHEQG